MLPAITAAAGCGLHPMELVHTWHERVWPFSTLCSESCWHPMSNTLLSANQHSLVIVRHCAAMAVHDMVLLKLHCVGTRCAYSTAAVLLQGNSRHAC